MAVPTDTLYGLAASALHDGAVRRLFLIKERPESMALPLLLADAADIAEYTVEVPDLAWRLAETFFPGPLTLVLLKNSRVPDAVTGGLPTVAVRVPDHWVPRTIARELGMAITGTSANRSGGPGPATAEEVRRQLGDEVDVIVDAGKCWGGVASTVLDVSRLPPRIIRHGAVSREQIEEVCGHQVISTG